MLDSLRQLWPSGQSAAVGGLWGGLLFAIAGQLAGRWHERGGRVGDTRKLFHLSIFTGAALLRWQVDSGAVMVYGIIVATGVVWSTWHRSRIYNALARPGDAPHQQLHVLSPLACTAIGGVLAHVIAGSLAGVAYLIAGWGDAVGEPVGIRWGRHRYRVLSCGASIAQRSWEGSAAVFVASTFAAALGLVLSGRSGIDVAVASLLLGFTAAVVESMSPHGWDNLTLLVSSAGLTQWYFG